MSNHRRHSNSVVAECDRDAPALVGVSSLTSAVFGTAVSRSAGAADISDLEEIISDLERVWLSIPGAGRVASRNAITFRNDAESGIQFASSSASSILST